MDHGDLLQSGLYEQDVAAAGGVSGPKLRRGLLRRPCYRPGPYSNREELLLAFDRFQLERVAGGS